MQINVFLFIKKIGKCFLKYVPFSISSRILLILPDRLLIFKNPIKIVIEPTNICNLRCPLCLTGINSLEREKGFMTYKQFVEIFNTLPNNVRLIELFFMGEPFLNKDIFKMIRYAEDHGKQVKISTNATVIGDMTQDILDSGLSDLWVCLDGATKKTHEEYRVGSNFEDILRNIKKLCSAKKEQRLSKPFITLQFLIMKHNEHEIPQIKQIAKQLGVDHIAYKRITLGTTEDIDQKNRHAEKFLPKNKKYIRDKNIDIEEQPKPKYICQWTWMSTILWNGDIIPCCHDPNGELIIGNVFQDGGFQKIYKSKRYKNIRKQILQRQLTICKQCTWDIEPFIDI